MKLASLARQLETLATPAGLALDGAALAVPALAALQQALAAPAPLLLHGIDPADLRPAGGRLTLVGTADLLGATGASIRLDLTEDGDAIAAALEARLPAKWSLPSALPTLDRFPFTALRLDGEATIAWTSTEATGLALAGSAALGGSPLAAALAAVIDGADVRSISGTLGAPDGTARLAIALDAGPVAVGVAPAAFSVHAPTLVLALDPHPVEGLPPRPALRIEGLADGTIPVAIALFEGSPTVALTVAPRPAGPGTRDLIAALPGGAEALERIPEALREVFAEVSLEAFSVIILGPRPRIGALTLALATRRPWAIIPGTLELEGLRLVSEVVDPAGDRQASVTVEASAELLPGVFPAPFAFTVELGAGRGRRWEVERIGGHLTGAVPLGRLIDGAIGEGRLPDALRDVHLDTFGVAVEPGGGPARWALYAAGDVVLPLGARALPARLSVGLRRDAAGTTAQVTGGWVIADRTFALDLDLGPGGGVLSARLEAAAEPLGFDALVEAMGLDLPALEPGESPALIAAALRQGFGPRTLDLEATVRLPVPGEIAALVPAEPIEMTARFGSATGLTLTGAIDLTAPDLHFAWQIALSKAPDGARRRSLACALSVGDLTLDLTFERQAAAGAHEVRCAASVQGVASIAALLERLGIELHAEVRAPLAGLAVPTVAVTLGGGVHLALGVGEVTVQLWRRDARWRAMIEVGGAQIPPDLPLGPTMRALLRNARARWVPASLTPDLPGIDRRIDRGLAITTILPFHATEIGRFLGGEATFGVVDVPIALRPGAPEVRIDLPLLPLMGRDRLEVFDGVAIHALDFRFVSPGQVGLRLGCDLTLPFGGEPTLRFVGQVEADLVDKEITLGVGLLGEVVDGALDPAGWRSPFGFPGLTIGRLELMLGPGLRAFTGALTLGRASLQVDAVIEAGIDARTAVYVRGEHLTVQDLLDGFMADDAPRLPGVIGGSGFRSLEVDLLTGVRNGPRPAPFTHTWPSGTTKTWEPGFRATGTLSLFGLAFAAHVDLAAGRFAGSMSRIEAGPVFLLEAPEGSGQARPATWPTGLDWLGGPWMDFDARARRGDLHGRLVLFGIFSKQIDAALDGDRLEIVLEESVNVPAIGGWTTRLTAAFTERSGGLDVALGGSLRLTVKFNPRDLLDELTGVDIALLDLDLLDLAFEIAVSGALRGTVLSGRLDVAFELWGERITFALQLDTSLDADTIAERALAKLGEAALDVMALIGKLILKAVLAALEAIGEALEAVGEAIVWALERLAEALEWVGEAIEALGEALADAGAEFVSWLGIDGPKEDRRRAREAELRRAREAEARRRAEVLRQQARRRALMLDRLEHLADGALASPDLRTQMDARIAAYHDTHPWPFRINPVTEAPEFDPSGSRAGYARLWHEALARAERREALRREFRAVLDEARTVLDGLGLQREAAEAEAEAARARLAAARARVEALRARLAGEIEAARQAASGALLIAGAGVAKVETALEESSWIVDRVRADDAALAAAGERVAGAVATLTAQAPAADAAIATAQARLASAGLEAALAAALTDEAQAAAILDEALARLAIVEARLAETRTARDTLTLARLEAVRLWRAVHFAEGSDFEAWRALCRQAGGAARIRLEELLLDDALALLGTLPAQALAALEAGVALAEANAEPPASAAEAPPLALALAEPSDARWAAFLGHADATRAWLQWPAADADAQLTAATDAAARAEAAWIRADGRRAMADLRLRANRALEGRLRVLEQAQRDAEAVRQALLEAEAANHAARQYDAFLQGLRPYIDTLAHGPEELDRAARVWVDAGERAFRATRNAHDQLTPAARIDPGIRNGRGRLMSQAGDVRGRMLHARGEVGRALGELGAAIGDLRGAANNRAPIPPTVTDAPHPDAARSVWRRADQTRAQLQGQANRATNAIERVHRSLANAGRALSEVERFARILGDMPREMGRVARHASLPIIVAAFAIHEMISGQFNSQRINEVQRIQRPQLPAIGRPPQGAEALRRIEGDFSRRRQTLADQRRPIEAIAPDPRSRERAEAEAREATAAEQAARATRDATVVALKALLDARVQGRAAVEASLPAVLQQLEGDALAALVLRRTEGLGRAPEVARQRAGLADVAGQRAALTMVGEAIPRPVHLDAPQLQRLVDWTAVLAEHGRAVRVLRSTAESAIAQWPATLAPHGQAWQAALVQGMLGVANRDLVALRAAAATLIADTASIAATVAADRQAVADALESIAALTASARAALESQRARLDEAVRQYGGRSVGDSLALVDRVDALDRGLDGLERAIEVALRFTRRFTPAHRAALAADLTVMPATTDLAAIERAVAAAHGSRDAVRRLADQLNAELQRIAAAGQAVEAPAGAWAQGEAALDADLDRHLASYREVAATAAQLSEASRAVLARVAELIGQAQGAHDRLTEARAALAHAEVRLDPIVARLADTTARVERLGADPRATATLDLAPIAPPPLAPAAADVMASAARGRDLARRLAEDLTQRRAVLSLADPAWARRLDAAVHALQAQRIDPATAIPAAQLATPVDADRWALEVRAPDGAHGLLAVALSADGRALVTDRVGAGSLFRLARAPAADGVERLMIRSAFSGYPLSLEDGVSCAPENQREAAEASAARRSARTFEDAAGRSWLALRASGPRLIREAPDEIRLTVKGVGSGTLLEWGADGRRLRLVKLDTLLGVVADAARLVSAPVRIDSASQILTLQPGADGAWQVRSSRRRRGGRVVAGPPRITRIEARFDAGIEVAILRGRSTAVGAAPDHALDPSRPGLDAPLTAEASAATFGVGLWLAPASTAAPDAPDALAEGVGASGAAWQLRLVNDAEGTRALRLIAPGLDSTAPLGPTDWHHLAVVATPSAGGAVLALHVDGQPVLEKTTALGAGPFQLTITPPAPGAVACPVLWGQRPADGALARHLLHPQRIPAGLPLAWQVPDPPALEGGEAAADDWPIPRASGDAGGVWLEAERVADRHGHPAFRLSQVIERTRRYLAWTPAGGIRLTTTAREAAEISLRARVSEPLDPTEEALVERIAGPDGAALLPPVTGATAARLRAWEAALRRALEAQVAEREAWLMARRTAADLARRHLQTAGFTFDARRRDRAAWVGAIEALQLRGAIRQGGLQLAGSGSARGGWLSLGAVDAPASVSLTAWVLDAAPRGPLAALVDPAGQRRVAVHLAPAGESRVSVRVEVGAGVTTFDVPWKPDGAHLAISCVRLPDRPDGAVATRVSLRIDGGRAMSRRLAAALTLDAPVAIVLGGAPGLHGRVEQACVWRGGRSAASVRREIAQGVGGAEPDLACAVSPATATVDGTRWVETIRGGCALDAPKPPLPAGVRVIKSHALATPAADAVLAEIAQAPDPIGALCARTDQATIADALCALGLRPTRAALDWTPSLWSQALASHAPDRFMSAAARAVALRRVGVEPRPVAGLSSPVALLEALKIATGERRALLETHGWSADALDDAALDALDMEAMAAGATTGSAATREAAIRRLGLEPRYLPLPDPRATRLAALAAARVALEVPAPPALDLAAEARWIQLDQLLLLPLLDQAGDGLWIEALRRGEGLDLEGPLLAGDPPRRPPAWAVD